MARLDGLSTGRLPQVTTVAAVVVLVVTATAVQRSVDCARILAVEVVAGRSHWNFMGAVLRYLYRAMLSKSVK